MDDSKHDDQGRPTAEHEHALAFGSRLERGAVAGHVPCPACGHAIEYTLVQVGRETDCPKCGYRNLRVGQSLLDRPAQAPMQAPTLVVLTPRRFSGRTLSAMFGLLFVGAAIAGAIVFTSSRAVRGALGWKSEAVHEGGLPTGTADVETANLEAEAPDITLEAIEALLKRDDLQEALVQAQVWQQMLRDYQVGEEDPRLLRLRQIIEELSARLAPAPVPPPAFIGEFRQALADLRNALLAEDVPAGHRALQHAERLFEQHPDELEAYGASLLTLKQRFSQQELLHTGRGRIRDLLTRAEQQIRAEKPTEAAEDIAAAMFLALRVPLSDEEFEERNATVERLEKELRFARGKRAIEEAKLCHDQNDLAARNGQLQVAFELLPDLPSGRVEDLITRGNALAELPIAHPVQSSLGFELDFRAAYEEALRFYGQVGVLTELADRCVEAHRRHELAPTLDEASANKVGKLILESLEFEVGDLLSRSSRSEEVPIGLARARVALTKAVPWQTTTQWRFIDSSLKSKGDEVASIAIEEGKKRASSKDLAGAVRLVEPAMEIAGPDVRSAAELLLVGWRRELAIQLRQRAEADLWDSIRALSKTNVLDAWIELQTFQQEFPDSKRNVAPVREWLQPKVAAAVAHGFEYIDQLAEKRKWSDYRTVAKQLASAPLSPSDRVRFSLIEKKLESLDAEAAKIFRETYAARQRFRGSRSVMAELLQELPRVLALNPDLKEAAEIYETVRIEASKHAAAMMIDARSKMRLTNKAVARNLLEQIAALDPEGELGSEARQLLKEIPAGS